MSEPLQRGGPVEEEQPREGLGVGAAVGLDLLRGEQRQHGRLVHEREAGRGQDRHAAVLERIGQQHVRRRGVAAERQHQGQREADERQDPFFHGVVSSCNFGYCHYSPGAGAGQAPEKDKNHKDGEKDLEEIHKILSKEPRSIALRGKRYKIKESELP
jgi:hypothetical protein